MTMIAGDFTKSYNDKKNYYDCVITCFFIDTAINIFEYIDVIQKVLKEGGIWINFGPLSYHWIGYDNLPSIELPYDKLKEVIVETDKMSQQLQDQENEINSLHQELKKYQGLETGIKDTIIKTEQISSEIKQSAIEEREKIINEAKQNASVIINEALLDAEKVELKAGILKKNIKVIKSKLSFILEEQVSIIKDIDNIEFEEEETGQ